MTEMVIVYLNMQQFSLNFSVIITCCILLLCPPNDAVWSPIAFPLRPLRPAS